MKGIEYNAYDLPVEVDWIGYDEYGCWAEAECKDFGECCWENRTIPHNLGVLSNYITKRGGKMVVVADGVAIFHPTTPPSNTTPTAADQQRRAARDMLFYQYCRNTSICVAYWPFLWQTIRSPSTVLVGAGDQPLLLDTLRQIGTEIKQQQQDGGGG